MESLVNLNEKVDALTQTAQRSQETAPIESPRIRTKAGLQVFDLGNDLSEKTAIAAQYPDMIEQIEAIIQKLARGFSLFHSPIHRPANPAHRNKE